MSVLDNRLTRGERRGIIAMLIIIIAIVATLTLCSRNQSPVASVNATADSTITAIENDTLPAISKSTKKKSKRKKNNSKTTKKTWTPRDPLAEPLPQH